MKSYYVEPASKNISTYKMDFFRQIGRKPIRIHAHMHPDIEVLYIINGEFLISCNDCKRVVKCGEMVLFRSNTIHEISEITNGGGYYYVLKLQSSLIFDVNVDGNTSNYLLPLLMFTDDSKLVWSKEECDANGLTEIFNNIIKEWKGSKYAKRLAIEIDALRIFLVVTRDIEMCSHTANSKTQKHSKLLTEKIYNAIEFINSNYNRDITLADCAKAISFSYSHFSHMFKQVTGKTFKEYLNMTRINYAERYLLTTDIPITQIATEIGFNNIAYFSAVYKKQKGLSPTDVRKRIRDKGEQSTLT